MGFILATGCSQNITMFNFVHVFFGWVCINGALQKKANILIFNIFINYQGKTLMFKSVVGGYA